MFEVVYPRYSRPPKGRYHLRRTGERRITLCKRESGPSAHIATNALSFADCSQCRDAAQNIIDKSSRAI